MKTSTTAVTLCLNQSYSAMREAVIAAVIPKIMQALSNAAGQSFVVEFNREATLEDQLYGDWAHVNFRTQTPILFAETQAPARSE